VEGSISKLLNIIDKVNDGVKQIVQVVKCNSILSLRQLILAVYHTIKAFKRGRNIAKKPYLELLLRLSGQKQIKDAINILGVPEKADKACLIITVCENCSSNVPNIIKLLESMGILLSENISYCFTPLHKQPEIVETERELIMRSALIDLL